MQPNPTRHAALPPAWSLASADIDSTAISLDLPHVVAAELARAAGGHLLPATGERSAGTHPMLLEFWHVRAGRMRALDGRGLEKAGVLWGSALALPWLGVMPPAARNRVLATTTRLGERALSATAAWAKQTFGTYHEVLVGVPGVAVGTSAEPLLLVAAMHTDSAFARFVDRTLGYGFTKRTARFRISAREIALFSESGQVLASLRGGGSRSTTTGAAEPPEAAWFTQSLLGRRPNGALVKSRFLRTALGPATVEVASLRLRAPFSALFGDASHSPPSEREVTCIHQQLRVELGAPEPLRASAESVLEATR